MQSQNGKYIENVKSIFQNPAIRQLIFMVGIAVSVAVGIVLYMSIEEPTYRPLDYQVTQQNMSAIIDTLDKAGIRYKVNDRDGVVLVAAKDLQLAKLKLSAAGVPKDEGFNYSFLNEQNGLSNSQFIENARYLRALENDLAKTISAIEGVSSARVHIAIPQNNVFADENNKVTASVVLSVSAGFTSDKEKVRSIMQIIADSVPGLDPKDVAITDQYGHFLSDSLNPDSIFNAAQLNYQHNIQTYYEKRIEAMIVPIVGENKVTVRVNADIDFTQQENAEESYDPQKTAIRSEQSDSQEDTAGAGASGPPGSLSNSPPSGDQGAAAASQASAGGGQKRTASTKNYELTKTVTYKKSNFAKIKGLSVAVVVDNEMVLDPKSKQYVTKALDADKITKITDLVKATIGFDSNRGDKVTVVNSSYNQVKQAVTQMNSHVWDQLWFWDVVKKIVGILLGFTFLFILYRRLSRYAESSRKLPLVKSKVSIAEEKEESETENKLHDYKDQGMTKLKQLASAEPEQVAMIIKNWVGK
ncbi:MAG: flagellar basal-body MS-ring/collar protein FliF [Gammaproteobacteria bacterium]